MKKIVVIAIVFLTSSYYLLAAVRPVDALECGEPLTGSEPEGVLRDYKTSCEQKLGSIRGQKATLNAAIQYLNTQISLTQVKILSTEKDLEKLNQEINDLAGKIDSIDYSLDVLTKLFIARVREAYIRQDALPTVTLTGHLQSGTISGFIRQVEYAKKIRDHDREILIALEKSRLDYDTQKTLKELKQDEVEKLKSQLTAQKNSLSSQKAAKDKLLSDTRNDEQRYAALLSQAQRQLASFRRFVSSQGGGGILGNETRCNDWGCYYNQRDSAWGNQFMGLSDSLMREYGCLVTSMAMVASHYGKSLKPGDIAAASEPFFGSTAFMNQGSWTVNGVTMTRTRLGSALSHIDDELAAGRPVVVGIYGGPDHFLVIKSKEGGEYIMHDPFPAGGNDIKFTSKYPLSAISVVDRVTVQ